MRAVQFEVVDTKMPFQRLNPFSGNGLEILIELVAETWCVGACLNLGYPTKSSVFVVGVHICDKSRVALDIRDQGLVELRMAVLEVDPQEAGQQRVPARAGGCGAGKCLVLLPGSLGLQAGPLQCAPRGAVGALRRDLRTADRLCQPRQPAAAAGGQQGGTPARARISGHATAFERCGARYPGPRHAAEDLVRNPERERARGPRCLPRGVEDLQQARRVIPGLSAEPPWSGRRPRCAEARRSHHAAQRSLTLPAGASSERFRKSLQGDSGKAARRSQLWFPGAPEQTLQ